MGNIYLESEEEKKWNKSALGGYQEEYLEVATGAKSSSMSSSVWHVGCAYNAITTQAVIGCHFFWVQFKRLVITYKAFHGMVLGYLRYYIVPIKSSGKAGRSTVYYRSCCFDQRDQGREPYLPSLLPFGISCPRWGGHHFSGLLKELRSGSVNCHGTQSVIWDPGNGWLCFNFVAY